MVEIVLESGITVQSAGNLLMTHCHSVPVICEVEPVSREVRAGVREHIESFLLRLCVCWHDYRENARMCSGPEQFQ